MNNKRKMKKKKEISVHRGNCRQLGYLCLAFYNKNTLGDLNNKCLFFTVLEAGNSRIVMSAWLSSGKCSL
jgi:hypothetical protein